jgi:hypothetical protein
LGEQILKLVTGERFIISTCFWEQEVYWKTEKGETIIKYQQAKMSSMEKGLISLKGSLTTETERLLISSGLLVRQSAHKRIAVKMAIIIPLLQLQADYKKCHCNATRKHSIKDGK